MIGFIKGLFRSKSETEVEDNASNGKAAPAPTASNYYFLDADDAKTFGDIEYMRSVKSTRRTFPKVKVGEDNELIQNVSALSAEQIKNGKPATASSISIASASTASINGAANGAQPADPAGVDNGDRRRTDTSLDAFRSMARDLRKR